jgi:hypothetical protein
VHPSAFTVELQQRYDQVRVEAAQYLKEESQQLVQALEAARKALEKYVGRRCWFANLIGRLGKQAP